MSRKFADFSFHRDNVFPNADEGSPKPMPPPSLPLMVNGSNDSSQASTYENGNIMQSSERLTDVVVIEEQTEIPVQKMSMEGTEEASSSLDADDGDLEPPKSKVKGKILFERGYSQIDWMKLTQSHPDLAGLKGVSNRRQISLSEVKQHKTDDDAWTILRGRVYNITAYMKFHPGGRDMLIKAAGRDCTSLFNKYHAWVNAEFLLEKCLVGVLEKPPLQE